jgi:hypothetical protein
MVKANAVSMSVFKFNLDLFLNGKTQLGVFLIVANSRQIEIKAKSRCHLGMLRQGSLTEGEGSERLTFLY